LAGKSELTVTAAAASSRTDTPRFIAGPLERLRQWIFLVVAKKPVNIIAEAPADCAQGEIPAASSQSNIWKANKA